MAQDEHPRPPGSETSRVGPHPSHVVVAKPVMLQKTIDALRARNVVSEAKEDFLRLNGCNWIDSVRIALQMPVRTFTTACTYYHKFRLCHSEQEYSMQDAAAAALFCATKNEDTLKKSRDILCAAHNLKLPPSEHVTSDDSIFEQSARMVAGLERLMLESSAFDMRSKQPHKIITKLAKFVYGVENGEGGRHDLAFEICKDIHRTFACLKSTTSCMAMAALELAGRIDGRRITEIEEGRDYKMWNTNRVEIIECMRDVLELYAQHRKETKVGPKHPLETFINIRIELNQEAEANNYPRYKNNLIFPRYRMIGGVNGQPTCDFDPSDGKEEPVDMARRPRTERIAMAARIGGPLDLSDAEHAVAHNGSHAVSESGSDAGRSQALRPTDNDPLDEERDALMFEPARLGQRDITVRFMVDGDQALCEKQMVDQYFASDDEEFEYDVEEVWDHKLARWVEVDGSQREVPGSTRSFDKRERGGR